MSLKRIYLTKNWHFRLAGERDDDKDILGWMPVARVPTNVHLDLLANGKYVVR